MRICCVSDTHKFYRKLQLPKADMLIHAGDIDVYRYDKELNDFNEWMKSLDYRYKILVPGNHDGYFESYSHLIKSEINKPYIYLENETVEIEGLKIYGSPITPQFANWSFMANRGRAIAKYWDGIPEDTNILITHGPPFSILDKTPLANGDEGESVGCLDLLQRIQQLKQLKIHIFGHIHYSYGIEERFGVKFVNASVVNEEYDLVNQPIVIDI